MTRRRIEHRAPQSVQHLLHHRVLEAGEERILLERAVGGDVRARDDLVAHNGRLVASIVSRFLGYGVDFEDLWQEGVIGLLDAIARFDLDRDVRFATYAHFWIVNRVQRYAQAHCSDIRWPGRAQRMKRQIQRGELDDVPESWQEQIGRAGTVVASVDQPAHDGDTRTLGELLPGEDGFRAFEIEHDAEALLDEDCLDDRDRYVLTERAADRTLDSIGKELGLTRERVRQLEAEATERLRDRVEAKRRGKTTDPKHRPVGLPGEQLVLPLFAEVAA